MNDCLVAMERQGKGSISSALIKGEAFSEGNRSESLLRSDLLKDRSLMQRCDQEKSKLRTNHAILWIFRARAGTKLIHKPKSGKHTPGKGTFYSGCLGKATAVMEIGGLGVVDLDHPTAFNLEAIQTPSPKTLQEQGKTLIDHYASVIIERKAGLCHLSKYLTVDAYFAKKNFIDQVVEQTQLEIVCKLRQDANLKYLSIGSPPRLPGLVQPVREVRAYLKKCTVVKRIG